MPGGSEDDEDAGEAGHREEEDADGVGRHGDDDTPWVVSVGWAGSGCVCCCLVVALLLVSGAVGGARSQTKLASWPPMRVHAALERAFAGSR